MNLMHWSSLAFSSLTILAAPLWSFTCNPDAVEDCLSAIHPSGDLKEAASLIAALPPGQQNADLNQLQPSLFKGFTVTQEQNTTNVRKAISRRLNERDYCQCTNDEDRMWALWLDVYGDHARQKKKAAQPGYMANTGAGAIGMDVMPVDPLIVGVAAAYSHSHFNWKKQRGFGNLQAAYGSLYASVVSEYIYTHAALLGGWLQEKGTRNISFSGLNKKASHTNNGGEGAAYLELGFNKNVYDVFTIIPFGAGDYIYIHENGFTEQGAKSLNLRVASTNSQLLRGEAGLKLSGCYELDLNTFGFDVRASWIREMRITGEKYHSSFQSTDCTFTTWGYFPNRSLIGLGIDIMGFFFDDSMSFALGYDSEFGANYSDQIVDLHIEWRI